MRFWSLASLLPLCLMACGDKGAVSLSVSVDQSTVSVQNGPLGATLGGGFQLEFALGQLASGPTTVTLGSFALQTAAGASLVDPLQVNASGTSFPLVVGQGDTQTVTFTLSSQAVIMNSAAICAGQVRIIGSVTDSLKGGTDPLQSALITPTCS
ncbi:MAG TPA: hypothetical protein VK745_16635 [Polyangiaceae bacterium]|jgi:hypothetical protein|nr:hypothetical protein [Polyangiaceae bacterium]